MIQNVCVAIGNSDDKLSQVRWSMYATRITSELRETAARVHGEWFTIGNSPWQGACWWIEIDTARIDRLKTTLRRAAAEFDQDSVAWLAGDSEMLAS